MSRNKIDLNLLPCFQVVAEQGSISKASSILHLTQPAISLQIKKLEQETGGRLFDRHNRGLVLTPLGSDLLTHVRGVLKSVEQMEELLGGSTREPMGVLRVGSYTTATSYLLPQVLKRFLKEFPEVSIHYCYESTETLLEMVKNYKLDCAVLSEAPQDPHLERTPFFKDELIFVTSATNKPPKNIVPREISSFSYLSYPLRFDHCYQLVEKKYGKYIQKCRIPLETVNFDTLKQTLLQGIGATFMPSYMIQEELRSGVLREIQISGKKLPIVFSFVAKKGGVLKRSAQEFRTAIFRFFR